MKKVGTETVVGVYTDSLINNKIDKKDSSKS